MDLIDEKLTELKLSKESPNTETLFSGFTWTHEWFTQAEEVLLGLAFRGESDKPILDFIRAKIRNTNIVQFNNILRAFDAAPITNHYELLVEHGYFRNLIAYCRMSNILDSIIIEHGIDKMKALNGSILSCSSSNIVIEYLIQNPHKIDWDEFTCNNNPKAAKYCIKQKKFDWSVISRIDDDEIVNFVLSNPSKIDYSGLSRNPNNIAVAYLLKHPKKINHFMFCYNTNNLAIEYLIANPKYIDLNCLCLNPNDKAVDYLLTQPDINYSLWSENINDKAFEYFMQNRGTSNSEVYSGNPNSQCVDYLLKHPNEICWTSLCSNSNDNVLDYILKHIKYRNIQFLVGNECEYNMQKLREFNKLGLFPRIQYLKI